jgi:flavin reductase (DIM6/NTAB) family NADH-FMN oxidoreductase RutF
MTALGQQVTGVSAAEFRQAMSHFPTGVTVVTSVGADGEPVGTTANAVTSLSLDPPLVLVCFDLASLTLRAVRDHGAFVVNVLAEPQRELSANFARRGFAAAWDGVGHRPGRTGSPRIHGVLAVLDCTVEHQLPGGDHEIVVGRVREVEITGNGHAPLVFWRGGYASLDARADLGVALTPDSDGPRPDGRCAGPHAALTLSSWLIVQGRSGSAGWPWWPISPPRRAGPPARAQ